MAERPLYTLYKNLKAQNYDVPNDYNKFESALTRDGKSGADNRHAIYENLKAQNFDVPSTYERFYSALFEPRSKTSSRAKGGSVPMTAADRARYLAVTQSVLNTARQVKRASGNIRKTVERAKKFNANDGKVTIGFKNPLQNQNVQKNKFNYNRTTGKTGTYTTTDGVEFDNEYDASQHQNKLDKYGEEWNNAVDMGIVPSELDKADPDLSDTDVAMRQMERRQEWLDENQNRRSKELNESMHLQDSPFVASGGAVAPSSFNTAISNEANRLSDVEYGAYNTAKAYNQMLRTTLLQELKEQKQRNENAGWWKDKWNDVSNYFGAMFNTMLDPKLYSQGIMDAAISNNLLQVKKGMEDGTIKKGSNAGNAAQAMLGAIQQQQGEAAKQQQYGTKAYQYGDMNGRSLKFMADFALSGWRNVMTTGFTKAGEKVGEKMALGALGKWFTKNTGRVLGDIAGSAALAATNQLGSTYNNVIERYVGMNNENGGVTQDKNGDLKFNEGVSLGKAIKDGFGSATIENFSEMFGEYLPGASKLLSKLGLSKVSSFFEKIGNNAYYKWLSNATNKSGIQGVMAEISEEEFGTALHAAWGDGDGSWSDFNVFTNPDAREKQIDTCLGMFYSVGFMQAPRTAVGAINAVQYFKIKHQVNKADKFGQGVFNDNWDEIKSKIDVSTNADLTKTVLDATRSDSMTAKQKGAVINYAMFLSKLRGFNQAADAKTKDKVEEGDTAPTLSNDLDDAYTEGHNADDADKHDIQLKQEDQTKTLAAALGISEQQLSAMSDEELESLTGQDDKLDQAIYDYQLSSARYQGVVDDAQDKVDLAAHQAGQRVDMYTDRSRGSVRNATIKASGGAEDYGVYIISGNIATHEDGSIDVSNSDDMILYYDPTTNSVEHADALMFAELGEELPADDVKAQAINDAKENAIKKIAGIIDGTVEAGSQFSVTDADGTEHIYEVLADNGDGTAMITIDGNVPVELVKGENVQIPYPFADLQQMKDMEDQKRLETAKAEREQMEKERAAQQTQETEQTPPSFDSNQILNDNGNVVLADVLGKDGNTKYPNSQLFLIRDSGAKAKVMELKSDGTLVPHAVNKKDVRTATTMSIDEYKQAFAASSMIEDNSGENRGEIEVEPPTIEGETDAPAEETAASETTETPATEQTPVAPAITLEDGTEVPMLEDGNPDFSKLTAAQTAELYDNEFGEDADSIVSGYVSDAKKALDKANNMTVKGKTFVEQKASKDAKEKAIADAQAAYDSAIAIRDAYNERQLAKVEDTAEGRKELIEKARRKFARLKSAVKDDAEAVAQLYKEAVGSLLHRLYDGTGIDVTDTIPLTAEEYVASNLGAHSLNYEGTETSKGVKQETGLSREDFVKTQLLAADGKGTTIDALVHSLWENRPSNLDSLDTQDIRNALIGVLTSGFKASEARSFIENIRIAQAEKLIEGERTAAENAAYYEQQKAKEEEEKKKAELEKKKAEEEKAEEEKTEENENTEFPDKLQEGSKAIEAPEDATDEKPLGEQLDETDLPFSAKENGKQQTTAERTADVEKNKVDDMKVVDNIIGQKTRKTLEKLAKMMGANVQWQYSDKNANGWFDDKTNTIYLTLDSSITEGVQFIFGHEMTHEMRTKNPAAYDELKTLVEDMIGEDAFNSETDRITSLYNENNVFYNGGRTAYEEEVVADQLGKWIRDANYAHTLLLKMSHSLLAKLHEIVNRFLMALHGIEISDDMNLILRSIEQAYVKTANGEVTNSETGEDVSFSLRQKPEPKKKGIGYKVFVLKDGKLYPPMVANPNGAATPVGVWLDADAAPIAGESKTGRPQVKQGGKGTQGGSGKLAYRPGWHLGVVPYAIQFNRKDAEGNKTLFPKNFVFAEVEYAADVDYQEEARQEGINPSGKYQHSLAGLKHLPTDGYYMYRTNPNPETDPWVITGAMKVNRILTRAEQADLVSKAGREPQQIQDGDIVTDDVVNSINQEIADAPKFSLKDNQGNPLNQDGTLKLDKIKSVDELTDEDFLHPTRNVELPSLPKKIADAIGTEGKPVVIKKNIFERNYMRHKDVTPELSKVIFKSALYNPDLYGQNQKKTRPYNWVLINTKDEKGNNRTVLLEVNPNKDNVEIVHWHFVNDKNLGLIKKQAIREGDQVLILPSEQSEEVGGLSNLTDDLSAAKIDNSSETTKENGEKFSLKDEKTMFGMHNISLDKLRKAIKQGGFAAPSMGVIDSKNGIYSGYGEITLIPKAEKIAKRTGKNIGTYAADAWTPIYPPVEKKFGGNGGDVAYDDIESVPKEMQRLTRNAINSFMDGREANGLAYLYLQEKGKAPELVHVEGKYPKELHDEVKGILGKLNGIYNTTDEQKEKLLDLFIREVYDGNKEEFDNDIKKFIKKYEELIKKRPNSNIAKNKQLDVDWMKEHGYDYGALSRFVDGILRDAETSGKVDENATMKAAQQYIQDKGMKEDFDSWKEKLNDRYNVEEVIFAGYKPDGNRKYLPNTVENAVKVMKQDGKNASVGSASFSHFVASILKPMGTLDQIRTKKGNLTGNYEDVEKFQEKWQPVYDELADKMQPDAEPFESYGMDRLEEVATQKNPKKYAKEEYGVDLTDEDINKLNELIEAVKNDKPSIYFETKFMRPYGLDEFEKAIVPNDTPSDVVDALKMAGIDVSSYERGNAEDRQKVTMDAINSSDNIRFSLKSMMAKPEGWKQANKKAIHIAEAIERDPKFSLKNLDGTLIKAGTYFSGGGLVEEGLKGIIDPVVAVEYDEKISGVYRNNFGQHIVTADVRDVDPKELVKQIDGEVEYFHASPVCKNYSQAKSNHTEVELDKETAASTAEFINAVKPKVVTIENVKGYKDSDAMKIITDALDANGYTWDADVYNAADYGGYTNRERLIVRAVRDGKLPDKPKKMAHKSGWYEAVADIIPTLTEKKNGVAPWMDIRLKADGIDWRNIDKPLYVMGSAYADGKIPHAFADELLPTLRTKSGDVIVMPDGKVYRAMGRVLARVSGVSDDYKMPFSENLSHTIIGNGIPTQLTEHVIAPLLTGSDPKFSIRTYHGTGASFDKFDFTHMGEGEGSQAFGWGGYVTNSKDIAEDYTRRAKIRKDNGGFEFVTDMSANNKDMVRQYIYKYKDVNKGLDAMRKDLPSALEMFPDDDDLKELSNILAKKNEEIAVPDNIAYLYDVDIPDDNGDYLDWDAPLTDKQKNTIIKELRRLKIDFDDFKKRGFSFDGSFGGNAYDFLMYALRRTKKWKDVDASRAVSKFLSSIGFTGIKYKAGTIFGGAKEGDYNYVIFDENNANIVGNTRFSLRYDQFEHDLNQWKKDNNLPKDAQRPTIPQRNAGESAVDFLRRVDDYRKQMALWKTAPTYEQHLLSDDTALGEFNRELQRGSVLKRIAFQDSMLAIRKAQEAIMKEVGVDRLNMAEDAYTAENRSHGKGKNEFEEYNNEFLQPLRKAYHQMKKVLGDSYDNVRIYMMAKHGLERDAQMAFKKSLEADYEDVAQRSAAYKAYRGDMNRMGNDSGFELGYIDFTTWRQRDNALRVKYSPSYMNYRYDKMGIAYDYSGLSALFDGSDFEEAAHKLIKDIESKYITETHNLWDATNAATKKILRDGYKAGMMSKDTYQYVRDMYSHYIPLRGWDGTTADQVWDYIGGGKGAFNQTLKTAHGRTSIADDPIAYIENMAESGILLNNKNWVKQHLMLLAQNHPTSLLTLSKAWYVKSTDVNGNEEWIPATPQITSQMNSNQVKAAIDAFEQKMEQMAQTGDATQKRDGLNIAYPQTHSEEREHEVRVMKDGEEYVIYVNGDPQLAQAMNNTRAHRVREIQSGKLDRAAAWLGRKMAAAYTSLSPLFIPSNYFRDLTMTLASTAIREDAKYNYLLRKNLATSWNLGFMLRDYQNGKLRDKVSNGNATPKEQMFYDFMMNGGETGFVSSLDVEDLKKKFKNDLKDLDRWKANPVKVGHTIMDSIEFLNRAIEDSNRFAVYMTSIQYGRSIDEAVNDAKDVTLNFNRKGTGEYGWQMIRNLYLFINPAVQSLQTLGALVKHHPFKFTAVTAAWLASGVLVPIVNAALMSLLGGDDDKDKYWQFTKWDRRNNLIFWIPFTHEYVKIPLAQEFRAFYGVGDMIASKMMGGELAEESWNQYAEDLLGQVVDMLPLDPTGYDGNIAVSLMPNAIRPVFELAFNVDFTGKPLFKDTEYNKYDPNFTKAYVGTPDWLVRASKMVNSIGNDYPDVQQNSIDAFGDPRYNLNNPAVVDHVLSSYLGGAYTMGSQVLGVLTKSLNDPKEIKVADIPLFSKFVSNPDDRPVTKKQGDEFWDMKENHDRAANTLSKLKKQAKVDGDYSMLERFYGSEEYKQYKQDDVKVKKYEEDKKKERAEESGEEYRPHKLNAEDIYKAHATPKDDFEDLKLKQLYTKLNGFKTSYDLLVDTAPSQSDGYYNTNKAAIDAIDEISLDKQEISELKKGFLDDGKDAYNAEDMKQIRELRKKIISVLEKANKVVVANQKANAKKK